MKTAHDLVQAARAQTQEISVAEAQAAIAQADVLIDVREADEFSAGHVPGAVHMSRGLLEFKIGMLPALQPRDRRIVLYCKSGGRAALCAQSLQAMGYLDVKSIAGGYDAWVQAGLPTQVPAAPDFN